jgi:uncharacterized protein YjbI with pentapeptide repeats
VSEHVEADEERRIRRFKLSLGLNVGIVLLLSAAVASASFLLVWWLLGQPDLRAGAFEARDRLDIVKIALATVAGVGGVVALVVAYRKQRLHEAEDRRKEADSARENTKLFTERFGRAADQLGSERAAVRLSGLHALANLADDWTAGRQMCISVLCSYVQMPYSSPRPSPLPWRQRSFNESSQERSVRATACRLLADHLRPSATVRWDGYVFDFRGAVLDSADFSGCMFKPSTKITFEGAVFPAGGFVDFREVRVEGGVVDFTDAQFDGALVDFNGSIITNQGVLQFIRSNFRSGQVSFARAHIEDAALDFNFATFSGAAVAFNAVVAVSGNIQFSGATISAGEIKLYCVDATDGLVNFAGVTATGGSINLEGFYSIKPNMLRIFRADLEAANPNYADMDPRSYPPDFSDL